MGFFSLYWAYYRTFYRFVGHRTLVLSLFSFVITLTEGFGIAIFISYVQSLVSKANTDLSMVRYVERFIAWIGMPVEPLYVFIVLIGIFILRGGLVLVSNSYQFGLLAELEKKIAMHLAQVFAEMNYESYLAKNVGYFTNLVVREAHATVTAYNQITSHIPKVVSILTYLFLAFRLDPKFTLICIVFALVTALIFSSVSRLTRKYSKLMTASQESLTSLIIQMLQSFKYLYATAAQDRVRHRVDRTAKNTAYYGTRLGFLSALIPASSEPIIIIFLSGAVYVQGVLHPSDLSSLFIVMMFLYRVMRESNVLQGSWQTFNALTGSVDKVVDAMRDLTAHREKNGQTPIAQIQKEITFRDVSFSYGTKKVLEHVNIIIPARKMIGIVGESGSGKSTLVDLVTGILRPQSGEVAVDGIPMSELELSSYRRQIGYVTQESVVFDDSVSNNLTLWAEEDRKTASDQLKSALKMASSDEFVQLLSEGIHTRVGERGLRLSGGQRQRLAIARELYKNPSLLILDEATSALDSETEQGVQKSIDGLKGKTAVLIIAHRLSTVRACDQIYVLKNGRVVETGSFNELVAQNGLFKAMCDMQRLSS